MLKELKKRKVFVGLSGGVDSSVAAKLLQKQGYDVAGVHLRCWNKDGCNVSDAEDARRVAEVLNIPFYVLNLEEDYKRAVVDYMVKGYADGFTPNPDVMCNKEIKFGLFLKKALELGADYIATGHYVRIMNYELRIKGKGEKSSFIIHHSLFTAKDKAKDQSYFLWTLTQEQLKYCLFPIGDYLKSEVRRMAERAKLPTAKKKDSQGLCFIGKVTMKEFLGEYLPLKRGKVLSVTGKILGEHEGNHFYTIGQRHLGITNYELGIKGQHKIKPHYVVEKDVKTNTLVVAEGENHPTLYKKEIELNNVNFISSDYFPSLIYANKRTRVLVRVRYRQQLTKALFKIQNSKFKLVFNEPVKFVAPGQSAVFYSLKGEMLGGGVITA